MTDEKRLKRALSSHEAGEPQATFEYLYTKYKPLAVFIAARYLAERADIEDAVEETFVGFFAHAADVGNVRGYLAASVKNHALSLIRKNSRTSPLDPEKICDLCDDFDVLAHEKFRELVADLRRILPEEDVQIILLRLSEDLPFDEIGARLNEKVGTVKTRYYRALKKYRNWRKKA